MHSQELQQQAERKPEDSKATPRQSEHERVIETVTVSVQVLGAQGGSQSVAWLAVLSPSKTKPQGLLSKFGQVASSSSKSVFQDFRLHQLVFIYLAGAGCCCENFCAPGLMS